jgi:prepilin-type N-terminal cleavage/methylation domain-containing protein
MRAALPVGVRTGVRLMGALGRGEGFTIPEMMIVVVLLGIVAYIGAAFGPRGSQEATSPDMAQIKSASEILMSDIQLARRKAVTTGSPVSIIVPNEDGSKPLSKGYYMTEFQGQSQRVTKVVNFSETHPAANIFVGYWELNPRKVGTTYGVGSPALNTNTSEINLSSSLEFDIR